MVSTIPLTISATSWSMMENASSRGRFGTKCKQTVVVQYQDGIGTSSKRFQSFEGSVHALTALNMERRGHDTDDKSASSFCFFSDDGTDAGSGTSTKTRLAMNTRSAPVTIRLIISRPASAQRRPVDGSPPAPSPRVMCRPTSNFCRARVWSRCCLSVLMATVTAPSTPR